MDHRDGAGLRQIRRYRDLNSSPEEEFAGILVPGTIDTGGTVEESLVVIASENIDFLAAVHRYEHAMRNYPLPEWEFATDEQLQDPSFGRDFFEYDRFYKSDGTKIERPSFVVRRYNPNSVELVGDYR